MIVVEPENRNGDAMPDQFIGQGSASRQAEDMGDISGRIESRRNRCDDPLHAADFQVFHGMDNPHRLAVPTCLSFHGLSFPAVP